MSKDTIPKRKRGSNISSRETYYKKGKVCFPVTEKMLAEIKRNYHLYLAKLLQ
jgi:hypothetical protein